jgi:hypothetical protein
MVKESLKEEATLQKGSKRLKSKKKSSDGTTD